MELGLITTNLGDFAIDHPSSCLQPTPDRLTVTVVIPMYNNASTIGRAIESVLSQNPGPDEVIVVDDGSRDGGGDLVAAYRAPVRYVPKENGGPASARNTGLQLAGCDVIAFLDADDYWLPGFLRATTDFLIEHSTAGAVSTSYLVIDKRSDGVLQTRLAKGLSDLPTGLLDAFFEAHCRYPLPWTGATAIRRSTVESVGLMRTDLPCGEDIEYWCRIALDSGWGFVATPLSVYDQSSMTSVTRNRKNPNRFVRDIDLWKRDLAPKLRPEDMAGFYKIQEKLSRCAFRFYLEDGDMESARSIIRTGYMGNSRSGEMLCQALAAMPSSMSRVSHSILIFAMTARQILRNIS